MQDTLSKKAARRYYHSSSFKMALLFTLLLGLAACILGYFIYYSDDASSEDIRLLSMLSIILMLLVVVTSFFISFFVVRQINIIAETAKNIMDTGDLSRRILVNSRWDDLSYLSQILNDLLERIELLMQAVKRVSDNIAHDLRTPLTRLRTGLETLKEDDVAKERAEKLIAEADNLLSTFNAILRIANVEKGKLHQTFTELHLDTIMNDVIELYVPLAEEKNITINSELKRINFEGDKDLMFQAFANLLDNAIKFTPDSGAISITLTEGPHIVIADSGQGIEEEDKKKVFDRFFRAETSRHTPGNGLGLSLVAAVIDLHKGTIELHDNNPGLRVELSF